MGVTGLWKLIEASGKPIPLENLENKVLAIDISIWLHQVVKGYQDNKGGHLPNAHLLGLFNRVCKLLYFRIRPVFVFDGACPELKRQTIAKRAQQKSKIQTEADRLEKLLLESLAKEHIVKQALRDPEKLSPTKIVKPKLSRTEERDDMFVLPPLNEAAELKALKSELDEVDDEEMCPKRSYDVNINKIDVTGSHFKSLPADIRHDILTDIKETRKQNSWGKLRELPAESNDFSTYQMSRLLRRRQVQIGIEEAEKEMGGKTWSLSELEALLSEDGVLEASSKHAQKIASNEHTRFVLVQDIAKAMHEAKKEDVAGPSTSQACQPSSSKLTTILETEEVLDDEDFDLQRAIQMSLGNDPDDETAGSEEKSERPVKLNAVQHQKFSGTIQAHGLIRGFMMEYGQMNGDDIQDLMEVSQVSQKQDELGNSFESKFPNTKDQYVLYGTPEKNKAQERACNEPPKETESSQIALSSESEDEFVEVSDKPFNSVVKEKVLLTVEADLKSYKKEDDLFADIFETSTQKASDATEDVPDVEVASISSDDDTIPYDVSHNDFGGGEAQKDVESGFVSEEGKSEGEVVQADASKETEEIPDVSENEKFWGELSQPEAETEKSQAELSANEKFWTEEAPAEVALKANSSLKTPLKRVVSPPPAKVASPFFVNRKTPSSKKKQPEVSQLTTTSVTKTLFVEDKSNNVTSNLQTAAEVLRENRTASELKQMKADLADEQKNLAQERNKMDRMGTSITESMTRECKELLKLFGIPYIDSPMEAEAQCAFLNMIELTDGTISDDSDIWLFGGHTVYKNFFVQKKIVMEFKSEAIQQMFHLDRKKLIQLAMLVGSDYTVGINGIGAVTALEILAAFPITTESEEGTDLYQSLVSSLRKFREWFQNGKQQGPGGKTILKSKLKNIELFEGFPNTNIAKAYLEPMVDTNAEKFAWGLPDSESLIEYAKAKLGWTRMKTEEILAPVMKRLNEKKQSTIKDYFKSQVTKKFFDNQKMSKRVQKAVGSMGGQEPEEEKEKPKSRKRKAPAKKGGKKEASKAPEPDVVDLCDGDDDDQPSPEKKSSTEPEDEPGSSGASTSKFENEKKIPKAAIRKRKPKEPEVAKTDGLAAKKRPARIPETKQVIPQREKDKEEQEKAKKNAIDIFKNAKASKK